MAASVISTSLLSLKPANPFTVEKSRVRGVPSLPRISKSFWVHAGTGKKIKTDKPYGNSIILYAACLLFLPIFTLVLCTVAFSGKIVSQKSYTVTNILYGDAFFYFDNVQFLQETSILGEKSPDDI